MVEQEATHRLAGMVFGVHYTIITRDSARYQQHGAPIRRHGRGRKEATTATTDRFLTVQARQGTNLRNDLNASGSMFRLKQRVES